MTKLKDLAGDKWPEEKDRYQWPSIVGAENHGYNEALKEIGEIEVEVLVPLYEEKLHEFYYEVCSLPISHKTGMFIKEICSKFGYPKKIGEGTGKDIVK